jgi:hypothetical protein
LGNGGYRRREIAKVNIPIHDPSAGRSRRYMEHAMSRRKGEETTRTKNRDYPYQVEIDTPDSGGFGKRLDEMHRCAREIARCDFFRRPDYRNISRRSGLREWLLWCFRSQDEADRFHAEYGGRRLVATPNRRRSFDFQYLDPQ